MKDWTAFTEGIFLLSHLKIPRIACRFRCNSAASAVKAYIRTVYSDETISSHLITLNPLKVVSILRLELSAKLFASKLVGSLQREKSLAVHSEIGLHCLHSDPSR